MAVMAWLVVIAFVAFVVSYLCVIVTMDIGPDWFSGLMLLVLKASGVVLAACVVLLVLGALGVRVGVGVN